MFEFEDNEDGEPLLYSSSHQDTFHYSNDPHPSHEPDMSNVVPNSRTSRSSPLLFLASAVVLLTWTILLYGFLQNVMTRQPDSPPIVTATHVDLTPEQTQHLKELNFNVSQTARELQNALGARLSQLPPAQRARFEHRLSVLIEDVNRWTVLDPGSKAGLHKAIASKLAEGLRMQEELTQYLSSIQSSHSTTHIRRTNQKLPLRT